PDLDEAVTPRLLGGIHLALGDGCPPGLVGGSGTQRHGGDPGERPSPQRQTTDRPLRQDSHEALSGERRKGPSNRCTGTCRTVMLLRGSAPVKPLPTSRAIAVHARRPSVSRLWRGGKPRREAGPFSQPRQDGQALENRNGPMSGADHPALRPV